MGEGYEDKKQRIQQLSLLIHNCRVYGVSIETQQEYLDELNELTKE